MVLLMLLILRGNFNSPKKSGQVSRVMENTLHFGRRVCIGKGGCPAFFARF